MSNILSRLKHGLIRSESQAPEYVEYNGLRLPPPEKRFCTAEFRDNAYFLNSASREVERLQHIASLQEQSTILDIGSGQGRLALGLLTVLPSLKAYYGLDVNQWSVGWCKRNISAFHNNFRFLHLDVHNERYNPFGVPFQSPLQLPFANGSFDLIFLYSVFTHMTSKDIANHLSEIYRMLRPRGRAFFTVYVEEDCEDEAENPAGYLENLGASTGPLHRVRFSKPYFSRLISSHGFGIEKFFYRSEAVTQQSSFLVNKT